MRCQYVFPSLRLPLTMLFTFYFLLFSPSFFSLLLTQTILNTLSKREDSRSPFPFSLFIHYKQAYHSTFAVDPQNDRMVGNCVLLPLNSKYRGPAYPANSDYDIIDECLDLFRANSLFKTLKFNHQQINTHIRHPIHQRLSGSLKDQYFSERSS